MKRTKQTLSNYQMLTGDMGKLYPIGMVDVLPGDTIQHYTNALIRLSPMASPVMHPVTVRIHHFFMPHRLVWDGWEDFITGGPDGKNATNPPTVAITDSTNQIGDYLGIPPGYNGPVNKFPIAAYNAIFNEYYRDQDLVPERAEDDMTIANIAWEKDYFTSARPWPQKGDDVTIPLGEKAPVTGIGKLNQVFNTGPQTFYESGGTTKEYAGYQNIDQSSSEYIAALEQDPDHAGYPGIYADLAQATGIDVRDLRLALAVQRYQEARARYGSRFVEYLRYLGVRSSDARLDRPEYLGGGRVRISISEVLQTAPETGVDDPFGTQFGVGDMYGHGIAAMRSNAYRRYFEEHGTMMSLLSVRPKAMYQDGLERHWLRQDKEDYFQKELQFIGQQEVDTREIYAQGTPGTFGYQDRYREYREVPSTVHGEFRDLLNFWHLGRKFDTEPVLNQSFTDCNPSKRIFNVQGKHTLWMMAQHSIVARRIVARSTMPRII